MLLLAVAALAACNATKHLPSGAYLLTKNQVEIEKEPELPKEDQITKLELDKYIRQQPNKRFLGTNLPDLDLFAGRYCQKQRLEPLQTAARGRSGAARLSPNGHSRPAG